MDGLRKRILTGERISSLVGREVIVGSIHSSGIVIASRSSSCGIIVDIMVGTILPSQIDYIPVGIVHAQYSSLLLLQLLLLLLLLLGGISSYISLL